MVSGVAQVQVLAARSSRSTPQLIRMRSPRADRHQRKLEARCAREPQHADRSIIGPHKSYTLQATGS